MNESIFQIGKCSISFKLCGHGHFCGERMKNSSICLLNLKFKEPNICKIMEENVQESDSHIRMETLMVLSFTLVYFPKIQPISFDCETTCLEIYYQVYYLIEIY